MELIALGDTHGRTIWKEIVRNHTAEKVVFSGDYFDTHGNIGPEEQIANFDEIIDYKKQNPGRVILLIGNHDYHYLDVSDKQYSGYQERFAAEIGQRLEKAIANDLLQMCFVHNNLAFTHAGITKTWCRTHGVDEESPEISINELFRERPEAFEFSPGARRDPTGNEVTQTPIWVRPQSLRQDGIDNFTQVVGHTMQRHLVPKEDMVLIDTLGTSQEYLCIDENGFQVCSAG